MPHEQPPLAPRAAPRTDEHGRLLDDLPCFRCGYNLHGLSERDRCPECGTPVGISTQGNQLRFADPEWLATVALGLKIMLWMILVGILLACVTGGATAALPSGRGAASLAGGLLAVGAGLFTAYGVWLMTTADPSGIDAAQNRPLRTIVRVASLFAALNGLTQVVGASAPGPLAAMLAVGVHAAFSLLALVAEYCKYLYFERLAARIPDDLLVRRARLLRWGMTISLAGVVSGLVIMTLAAPVAPNPAAQRGAVLFAMVVTVPCGLAVLILSIVAIFYLLRMQRTIAREAETARMIWLARSEPVPSAPNA